MLTSPKKKEDGGGRVVWKHLVRAPLSSSPSLFYLPFVTHLQPPTLMSAQRGKGGRKEESATVVSGGGDRIKRGKGKRGF